MQKKILIINILIIGMVAWIGCGTAAILPNGTPETQLVKTSVSISVASGTVGTSESMVVQVTNTGGLNDPPLLPPPGSHVIGGEGYPPMPAYPEEQPGDILFWNPDDPEGGEGAWGVGQVQVINAYSEMSDFKNGATEYKKDFTADTGNKVLGQYNIVAHRNIQYLAQTNSAGLTGSAETTEKLVLDAVGTFSPAANSILCPFAATFPPTIVPPFCNIVQADSSVSGVQIGSLITDASKRDIQATADFPAEFNYGITAKVVSGSVNAFMDVHAQEGRMTYIVNEDPFNGLMPVYRQSKAADFVYKESDTATGQINSFSKMMYYQDGMLRI